MSLTEVLDSLVKNVSDFAGGDIVAVITIFATVSLALVTTKTILKVVVCVICGLAVLYLVDANIYSHVLDLADRFLEAGKQFLNSISTH